MNELCKNIGCNDNRDGRCMTIACAGADKNPADWSRCGYLRRQGDRVDCEMRSGEGCCHDATECEYWHER